MDIFYRGRAHGRGQSQSIKTYYQPRGTPSIQNLCPTVSLGFAHDEPSIERPVSSSSSSSLTQSHDSEHIRPAYSRSRGHRELFPESISQICPQPPPNGKHGSAGKRVQLQANYFRLASMPTLQLYQYHVDFSPDVPSDGLRKCLLRQHKSLLNGYLFDGIRLFVTKQIQHEQNNVIVFKSKYRDTDEYNITIKRIGEVSMQTDLATQILNLIMKRVMDALKLQLIGRNFFDADAKIYVNGDFKIQLWPGYLTSIRQHQTEILMCADITHKVMRRETILSIMQRVRRDEREYQIGICKSLLGQIVLTAYNNKTYRIDDIDFNSSPQSAFQTRNGPISYIEYYKKQYNIDIVDVGQPLLQSKAKRQSFRGADENSIIALIPELCWATGFTTEMRSNFRFMKSIDQYTRTSPDSRQRKLLEFNKRLNSSPQALAVFKEWDLKLDSHLIQVPGRVLDNENIIWSNMQKSQTTEDCNWTRDSQDKGLYSVPHELKRWYVVVNSRLRNDALQFVNILIAAAKGMKFTICPPREMILNDDRPHTIAQALEDCAQNNPQFIMCIVSNQNADRYSTIKRKCCIDRPIATQVICHRTIIPKHGNPGSLMSIGTKVAIQINCKLGGAPWAIEIPVSGLMTIGFDVTRDAIDKNKSYGTLVASMDLKQNSSYFSAVSEHQNGEKLSDELGTNTIKAVRRYHELHGKLPDRICFYRGGVGEGQIQYVKEHEVKNLIARLNELYDDVANGGKPLKLAFIIVCTRINTKIFNKLNGKNPVAGTVVDDVVTLPERYDFYLIPQSVRQGTVSPTSFNVIHDTMGLSPDRLQRLTYKMCHLYYNWCGTIRVPAVYKCASKLGILVGHYLHQLPHVTMEQNLYFL